MKRWSLVLLTVLISCYVLLSTTIASARSMAPESQERSLRQRIHDLLVPAPNGWAMIRDYAQYVSLDRQLTHVRQIIYEPGAAIAYVFGPYAGQAQRVASCESGHSIWARNGQYLGLFQMGDYARSMYGHGNYALAQARAAYRYFVASGRDWSPWECKPW